MKQIKIFKCITISVRVLQFVLDIQRVWMNGVTKLTHAKAILVAHLSENIRKQGIQELIEHL